MTEYVQGLNPIAFMERVNREFIDYQLTAFPLTDPRLADQARMLLRGPLSQSPLVQGPYVSLSHSFAAGADLRDLAKAGVVHPALPGLTDHPTLFAHQEEALHALQNDQHVIIATGTGSGKTEAFLYPIFDHCLRLRDAGAPEGIVAILVYPMNALALDQLSRLRGMLAGSGISFGLYIGQTAQSDEDVTLTHLKAGEGRDVYAARQRDAAESVIISPHEERRSEQAMVAHPPRILLTNVNQLELLLTRGKDLGMFAHAPLRYLVFDEAHTYRGANGAEVACLIRRLRTFCGRDSDDVLCVGTSATVSAQADMTTDVHDFAHRFFGVDPQRIAVIRERYVPPPVPSDGQYQPAPPSPSADTGELLNDILATLNSTTIHAEIIRSHVLTLSGNRWNERQRDWRSALFDHLCANPYVRAIFNQLDTPCYLPDAVQRIHTEIGRVAGDLVHDQAELLSYLVLGAVAERDGFPLLRPKVHLFVRGLEGAVLTFAADGMPQISLSRQAALERGDTADAAFNLLVCKTCGQHYAELWLHDAQWQSGLEGGQAENDTVIWQQANDGDSTALRVVFTDKLLRTDDEDIPAPKTQNAYLCRHCGTLHRHPGSCQQPKCRRAGALILIILPVSQKGGKLDRCASCGQRGGHFTERQTEPIKPLRASTVADNYILAQNMINAVSASHQKLIIFTDNRQDAAFQAGWMQDHARGYRLRHIMYKALNTTAPTSLGDVHTAIIKEIKDQRDLATALAPEVFERFPEEGFSQALDHELRKYFRIQLLREAVTSFKQRDNLENWGLVRFDYVALMPDHTWIRQWAQQLALDPAILCAGVGALLDAFRRTRHFYDPDEPIFTKWWREGDEEIQFGYLPFSDISPKGLKLRREEADKSAHVGQLLSSRGQTLAMGFVERWPIAKEQVAPFLESLWQFLVETKLVVPVVLVGGRGKALPGAAGVYQINSREVGLTAQRERYRCALCQRIHTRPTPGNVCTAHHCQGKLVREEPPADDYNIERLEHPFTMVRAQEHSAQIPAELRAEVEHAFKQIPGRYNCLVATPTLEMGVDIGALDMILLRNVPPTPSNYWQRVGRAGRRHRMAVMYTYCRRAEHDRYFFADPLRLLNGAITVPRFNLHNAIMIRKHVHAAILSELIRIEQAESGWSAPIVHAVSEMRQRCFPRYIRDYLFADHNTYRDQPPTSDTLRTILSAHHAHFFAILQSIFAHYWPDEERTMITAERLNEYLAEMPDHLEAAVTVIFERFLWARKTQQRLTEKSHHGLLEPEEERVLRRCQTYLKQLADDNATTYTLSVLAREGFLPGYGTYESGIIGYTGRNYAQSQTTARQGLELTRAPAMAIREFVPGNLIYANSGRFKATQYHLPIREDTSHAQRYIIEPKRELVRLVDEQTGYRDAQSHSPLVGLPICEIDLSYVSRISDDEQNRFQLPVAIFGKLLERHQGGHAYQIGSQILHYRDQQGLLLLNAGPADRMMQGPLGYPICHVCGQVRSPYAANEEISTFMKKHKERCGREPVWTVLTRDVSVNGFLFPERIDLSDAVNLGEALKQGAARVLEMELTDLQLQALPRVDQRADLFLYDPMPGGSGLLPQMLDCWQEVVAAAQSLVHDCPSQCERSCYQCLKNYRNSMHHGILDRHLATNLLASWDMPPQHIYEIPPILGKDALLSRPQQPTNLGEVRLAEILSAAGFVGFIAQQIIALHGPYAQTVPDFYHAPMLHGKAIAIYLDGPTHHEPDRRRADRFIRQQLENMDITVIEIPVEDLDDREMLQGTLNRIGRLLSL